MMEKELFLELIYVELHIRFSRGMMWYYFLIEIDMD